MMRRRQFILGLAGAAMAGPAAVTAQQGAPPVIGVLASGSPETFVTVVTGLLEGLKAGGFVEGNNLAIEYRWAQGQFNLLPSLAEELVQRRVSVIVTMGGNVAALAAKRATSTIPVVFMTGDDPVASGLVGSLNKPGGNLTGITWLSVELGAKNLELIGQLLPAAETIGVLINPNRPTAGVQLQNATEAANKVGKRLRVLNAGSKDDIEKAFAAITAERIAVLFVAVDPLFIVNRVRIIELAAKQAVPTLYFQREFVDLGGLMSYGASAHDASRLVGSYTGRIIRGDQPGDLPVQRSTKIETIINLKTAKSLGLVVPPSLLALADEVIE